MNPDWSPLETELEAWRQAGLTLPIWWRDDDATTLTRELERLTSLAQTTGVPVHLAVIPEGAQRDLARFADDTPNLVPVVHGWSHTNHANPERKKAEFGEDRTLEQLTNDARSGLARIQDLFGSKAVPLFVPPWNRIAPNLIPELPALGYTSLSTFTPRKAGWAAPGLRQINTHLDPINWKSDKALHDPSTLIDLATRTLQDRRTGQTDATEPFGLLTHHLVHDPEIWQFTEIFLRVLMTGPVQVWRADDTRTTGEHS
ncbi:MAG: polysaccharide deacetylase family protein [Paracoccaceae bacterium]